MNIQTAFWILIAITGIELLAIFALGNSIRSLIKSDFLRNKKNAAGTQAGNILLLLIIGFLPSMATAADVETVSEPLFNITKGMIYAIALFDLVLIFVILQLKGTLSTLLNVGKTVEEIAVQSRKQSSFMHALTDAIDLDKEHTIDLDHEYDGIRELDNNLPPWWIYSFYISIIFAAGYLVRYHVTKTADLQIDEYVHSMESADAEVKAYLVSQAMDIDESSVTQLTDASKIALGGELFSQYCVACHKDKGQGLVGPNLTDEFWLHGGDVKSIFKTIKFGAANGMKSWKDELNPVQMQEVSSFIMSLTYVSPADGGKKPQGDKFDGGSAPIEDANGTSENTEGGATSDVGDGEAIYKKNCMVCHTFNGGGSVGPNLTDEFWKNGGTDEDKLKVITEGVAGTSMVPWASTLSADEISSVLTYVNNFEPVNPPDGKEPEGDKYTP